MNANPHAEVDHVDVGDEAIALRGTLVGAQAGTAELVARRWQKRWPQIHFTFDGSGAKGTLVGRGPRG